MASLMHVCIWSEKGWKRITATEAARMHPGGTVSAYSGLFMCELCGQYVTLTHGKVQVSHFRHSSAEKSKDCPERKNASSISYTYDNKQHDLPIKIRITSATHFDLMIGFVKIPESLDSQNIEISINGDKGKIIKLYHRERINSEGISYLSIGNKPCRYYALNISGAVDKIYDYWPKITKGIDPDGTIFDGVTGKKLVYDSDVEVGKKYYLLVRYEQFFYTGKKAHVSVKEICRQIVTGERWEQWFVYEVIANDFHETSAKFFLAYHCRLTDTPVSLQTVWPVFIENPYIIKYNTPSIVVHLAGNAPNTRTFPVAITREYNYNTKNEKVLEITSNGRQQLISAGRTTALKYTYFWKVPLNSVIEKPKIKVKDLEENCIESGVYEDLPHKRSLTFLLPFDGRLLIKTNGMIIENRKTVTQTQTVINDITWGMEIYVYVGMDCVWKVEYLRRETSDQYDEMDIMGRLEKYSGSVIRIPHSIGSLACKLEKYPRIRKWLLKCIRKGYMSERAFREIQFMAKDIIKP